MPSRTCQRLMMSRILFVLQLQSAAPPGGLVRGDVCLFFCPSVVFCCSAGFFFFLFFSRGEFTSASSGPSHAGSSDSCNQSIEGVAGTLFLSAAGLVVLVRFHPVWQSHDPYVSVRLVHQASSLFPLLFCPGFLKFLSSFCFSLSWLNIGVTHLPTAVCSHIWHHLSPL